MFDIIIKNGKKESYIKLNGNKLEGFNAQNGVVTPLTIEEVNTINLLNLSDNKSYLWQDNDYDIYIDNISGLKHYFKDGKEDFEATWEHNGEDALLYSGDKSKDEDEVKTFKLKKVIATWSKAAFKGYMIAALYGVSISLIYEPDMTIYNIKYKISEVKVTLSKEYNDGVTVEQIESYIKENDKLTEEEKEMFYNEKLLEDVVPYYENTNMNILIPLKFDGLQTEYFYAMPEENGNFTAAYYDSLIPNRIFVNTYNGDRYDDKVHEYIHLLQIAHEYKYIKEASAEIISFEYDDKYIIDAYEIAVKNTKILMEIVGPVPIWKLNFSGDDTDLVNIIRENLEEEKANELISLLKEKPNNSKIKNLDKSIETLLSEMYQNMYGEDMRNNPFINCLLGNGKMNRRYYFNSDFIEKAQPYTPVKVDTLPSGYTFWYVYAFSSDYYLNPEIDIKNYIYNKDVDIVFMLSKNQLQFNDIRAIEEDVFEKNEIKFYYHGEEFTKDNFDLFKYEGIPFNLVGGINPEVITEIRYIYYPTIYESFPSQRIEKNSSITK